MRAGVPRGSSRALSRASSRIGHLTKAYAQVGGGVNAPSPKVALRRHGAAPRTRTRTRHAALLSAVAFHSAARVRSALKLGQGAEAHSPLQFPRKLMTRQSLAASA